MSKNIPVITIEELLSIGWENEADNSIDVPEKTVYGLGNAYIPDHTLLCNIPKKIRRTYGYDQVKVKMHILWLASDTAYQFSGLVVDKIDCQIYFVLVRPDSDTWGFCSFEKATVEDIVEMAEKHNLYLTNVAALALQNREALLDYQIYSPFTDRFYYMEMAMGDKMVLCAAGLNSNKLLAVGWLGKLINKDLFVSYAECTRETYEALKKENSSLLDRARMIDKNKERYSFFRVILEKRKKYPELVNILLEPKKEPLGTGKIKCFWASSKGTAMKDYIGPAYHWMEEFLAQCSQTLRNVP